MGLRDDGLLSYLPGVDFLEGGNDVVCPPSTSSAAADHGIRLAGHRYGVYHLRGRARRSWSARVAGQPRAVAKQHAAVLFRRGLIAALFPAAAGAENIVSDIACAFARG
jgi:hypothetical protein